MRWIWTWMKTTILARLMPAVFVSYSRANSRYSGRRSEYHEYFEYVQEYERIWYSSYSWEYDEYASNMMWIWSEYEVNMNLNIIFDNKKKSYSTENEAHTSSWIRTSSRSGHTSLPGWILNIEYSRHIHVIFMQYSEYIQIFTYSVNIFNMSPELETAFIARPAYSPHIHSYSAKKFSIRIWGEYEVNMRWIWGEYYIRQQKEVIFDRFWRCTRGPWLARVATHIR